nr:response regulator [Bacteroidota bacterium]
QNTGRAPQQNADRASLEKASEPVELVSEPVELEFFVKDTGIGIPKERQNAIFDRFVQADIEDKKAYEGAGLGLSISKAYVEMLGGKIWVESVEGQGSQFYFTIPYNLESEKKPETKAPFLQAETGNQFDPEISGLKILIAEDEEFSDMHLSLVIENLSKEILHAKTGIEAVELCHNNQDIDLVLMDIKMPEMNGYDAIRKIREFNKDVIIIAQTAYALVGDREKALEAGCNDYLSKPINKDKLKEVIGRYLF